MSDHLADDLALRIRAPATSDQVQLVRQALERYEPANLSELYMAIRAVAGGGETAFVESLRVHADDSPELTLHAFLAR